jgi:hypothetical protein
MGGLSPFLLLLLLLANICCEGGILNGGWRLSLVQYQEEASKQIESVNAGFKARADEIQERIRQEVQMYKRAAAEAAIETQEKLTNQRAALDELRELRREITSRRSTSMDKSLKSFRANYNETLFEDMKQRVMRLPLERYYNTRTRAFAFRYRDRRNGSTHSKPLLQKQRVRKRDKVAYWLGLRARPQPVRTSTPASVFIANILGEQRATNFEVFSRRVVSESKASADEANVVARETVEAAKRTLQDLSRRSGSESRSEPRGSPGTGTAGPGRSTRTGLDDSKLKLYSSIGQWRSLQQLGAAKRAMTRTERVAVAHLDVFRTGANRWLSMRQQKATAQMESAVAQIQQQLAASTQAYDDLISRSRSGLLYGMQNDASLARVLALIDPLDEGWVLLRTEGGVRVSRKQTGLGAYALVKAQVRL